MSPIRFCLQNLGFMTITKGNSAKYKNCILDLLPPFLSLPMNIRLIFLKHTLPYHHSTTPQAFKTPIIICHLIFFSKLRQLLLGKILCESKVYRDQFNNLIKVKNSIKFNTRLVQMGLYENSEFLSKCICIYFSKGDTEYFTR